MGNGNQRPCVGDLNFISRITQVTASAEGQRYARAGGLLRVETVRRGHSEEHSRPLLCSVPCGRGFLHQSRSELLEDRNLPIHVCLPGSKEGFAHSRHPVYVCGMCAEGWATCHLGVIHLGFLDGVALRICSQIFCLEFSVTRRVTTLAATRTSGEEMAAP